MSRSLHRMTEAARARAYARAMAMPAIGKWKKEVSTGGIPQYSITFEGRTYHVAKYDRGYVANFYETTAPAGHRSGRLRWLDRKGNEVEHTYSHGFSTPQMAIAMVRRFANQEGYPS